MHVFFGVLYFISFVFCSGILKNSRQSRLIMDANSMDMGRWRRVMESDSTLRRPINPGNGDQTRMRMV